MAFPDPRFFRTNGPLTAEEAAKIGAAQIVRAADRSIETVAEASKGGAGAIVFAEKNPQDAAEALAIIVGEGKGAAVPEAFPIVLEARSPKLAFAKIAGHLFRSRSEEPDPNEPYGAQVHEDAQVHPSAVLSPGCVIEAGAVIAPLAFVGHGVVIGEGTYVGNHASVTHAVVGKNCRILAGARIGEAGFGYTAGETGPYPVPQLGTVQLADEVDIGASTTVDRGTLGDTVIGRACKIDNLCQIAHNCRLGTGVLVASLTGISGSCIVGDFVMMGGQVGMADHLTIGSGAVLAARSGLMKDVEPGDKVGGTPAKPIRQWMKEIAVVSRLAGEKK